MIFENQIGMAALSQLRDRYLRDPLPVRLGGLAANLARIQSFSDHPAHREVVVKLIEESAWFVEWCAPAAEFETQLFLAECQRELVRWRFAWNEIWGDAARRAKVADQAGRWSARLLELSGFLPASK
ncbi:MAG: hypothetical protein L0209_07655 [candidate division Zixibacteria bacterium]|nr:hypothetical protein [candidate division Zixibacteria bacterium]